MVHVLRRLGRLTLLAGAALAGGGCASIPSARGTPNAADSLVALSQLDNALVEHTRHVLQTDVGLRLALGMRLDRLPSQYTSVRRDAARYARFAQRELEGIWYEALSQDDYLTLLAVHWALGNEAEAAVYRALDFSAVIPRATPLHAIARALSQHPIEDVSDIQRYLYLLDNLVLFFSETRQTLVEQAARGILIPRPALDSAVAFLTALREPAFRSHFSLDAEHLTRIDSLSRPTIVAALTEKIERDINREIDSLVAYMAGRYAAMQPGDTSGTTPLGLRRYPGGDAYYGFLLRRATTLDASPRDLYTYGVREVERITAAMASLRAALGFRGSDSAFRATLREDARFVIVSPNDFERRVEDALRVLRDSVRSRLGIVVADSVVLVGRASQALDGARSVGLREADGLDGRDRLVYAVDRVARLPAYAVPAIVAREIIPGRQTLLSAIRTNEMMPTIRQFMRFEGFVDGWSEHASGLAGELGIYADPHVAYGALLLDLEAAARMVTDLGLHYYGWSFQQAVRYLRVHAVDASATESDVLRMAVAEPARAVAAKVGSREFAGQRAWVRRELAEQFADSALQREVLRVGVLPLPVLSQHLAWWVWKTRNRGIGE